MRRRNYYFLFVLVWLLVEGGYYLRVAFILLGSQWIATRYMQAIQLGLIDAGSSSCSLSVLLSEMSLIGHSKQIKGGMAKVYTSTYTGKENLAACSPWKILLIRRSEITSEAIFRPQISAILSKKNFNQTLIVATYLLREVVANRRLRITYIVYVVATNGKHTLQQRYCSKIAF